MTAPKNVAGELAIENSERLYREMLGDIDATKVAAIRDGMPYLVDRVMAEASLYEPELAALSLAQAGGDVSEAVLLLRAWRTTQPRLQSAEPVSGAEILTLRRISSAYKYVPGGQLIGPSLDYSHRVLDVAVLNGRISRPLPADQANEPAPARQPELSRWQRQHGLLPALPAPTAVVDIPDITREQTLFPISRAHKLQSLARGDTGGLTTLSYASMRGYGAAHPTINELRVGEADLRLRHPCGTVFSAGRIRISITEVVSQSAQGIQLGFGASFGWNENRSIAAATLDLSSRVNDQSIIGSDEFVVSHTEAIDATGMISHLKLPHYVSFQSSLDALQQVWKQRQPQSPEVLEDVS